MIQLSKQEILHYQTINNLVLVKPSRGKNELKLPSGVTLHMDWTYEPEKHIPCSGTVITIPRVLDFSTMEWETRVEILPGDEVYFDYNHAMNSLMDDWGDLIMCEDEPYILLPYEALFCAKRQCKRLVEDREMMGHQGGPDGAVYREGQVGIVIPLNGYCLVSPLEENQFHQYSIDLPQKLQNKNSARFGKILNTGSLIPKYNVGDGSIYPPDKDSVNPGDIIAFDEACDLPIEFPTHASLFQNKTIFRIQRRFLIANVNSPEVFGLRERSDETIKG